MLTVVRPCEYRLTSHWTSVVSLFDGIALELFPSPHRYIFPEQFDRAFAESKIAARKILSFIRSELGDVIARRLGQ